MDDRLRTLERAWKETESADDERAFRLAQLRARVISERDLHAMTVRQVLIQPREGSRRTDLAPLLGDLAREDPLLQVRATHPGMLPSWRGKPRIGWRRTLAAPSDALLAEALDRFRTEVDRIADVEREVEISPPAPLFLQTIEGDVRHDWDDGWPGVLLRFDRRDDVGPWQVVADRHHPHVLDAIRRGVLQGLAQTEPVWLPFASFDLSVRFDATGGAREVGSRPEVIALVAEAITHATYGSNHTQVLEPWVSLTISGPNAEVVTDAVLPEQDRALTEDGRPLVALRRVPELRRWVEDLGGRLTWTYERHEPTGEDEYSVQTLLGESGWNLALL